MIPSRTLLLALCLLISGCTSPLGLPSDYRDRSFDQVGSSSLLPESPPPPLDQGALDDLDLPRARDLAIQRNHTVAAAAAAVSAAEARMAEARAAFLPQVTMSLDRSVNDKVRTVSIPGGGSFSLSPQYVTRGQASISLSLFAFGRDWEAVKAARADLGTQALDERAVRQQLLLQVTQAWYRVHEAASQVEVAEDARLSAERQLEDATNIYNAQRATLDAVLTARVDLLSRQQDLLVAQNALQHARRVLNVLLVREPDAPLTLASAPEFEEVTLDPATLKAYARQHNPTLLSFRSRRGALEHRRESVIRSFSPEIVGSVAAEYSDFRQASGYATNYLASLGVQWTPINGGRRLGQLAEIHANLIELRERELAALQEIQLSIDRAVLDLGEEESAVQLARQSIEAATENLRIISDRFRAGRTTSREVLEARSTLSSSRFAYNQARFSHRTVLALIESLVGVEAGEWLQSQ